MRVYRTFPPASPYSRLCCGAENELLRLISSTWNECFQNLYQKLFSRVFVQNRTKMNEFLVVKEDESLTNFEKLKNSPAKPKVQNLAKETKKLQVLGLVELLEILNT
jgi:hypothetical protein